ncbi:hypothetical protein DSO57_1006035 [Entomophthora muscae]|uniref:Uncharacterized protein n=1 Tax=Entomophthora muscae TaxID=34485 RepID=A0ACC2T807_9FUNG|nr:hypothetical protein DSO57_1006035 [Entomophthora muscae]
MAREWKDSIAKKVAKARAGIKLPSITMGCFIKLNAEKGLKNVPTLRMQGGDRLILIGKGLRLARVSERNNRAANSNTPVIITINQKVDLHPNASSKNPPIIGPTIRTQVYNLPIIGPTKVPLKNTEIENPLSCSGKMSETTPTPTTKGADEPTPCIIRIPISISMLTANAAPMLLAMKITSDMIKIHLLPNLSASPPHTNG